MTDFNERELAYIERLARLEREFRDDTDRPRRVFILLSSALGLSDFDKSESHGSTLTKEEWLLVSGEVFDLVRSGIEADSN